MNQYRIGQGLTEEIYESVLKLLRSEGDKTDELVCIIDGLHPADIADLIERLPQKKRSRILECVGEDKLGETLTQLGDEAQESALTIVKAENLAEAIKKLESDDRVDIVRALDDALDNKDEAPDNDSNELIETRELLAEHVSKEDQALLTYEDDTAGGIMQTEIFSVPGFWQIHDILDFMREHNTSLPSFLDRIYVIDHMKRHRGSISLSRLVRQHLDDKISDVMREDSVTVSPEMDQEEVARLFEKYDIYSCAVVDSYHRILGVITIDDILDVVIEENEADTMRAAGLEEGQDLFAPALSTSRKRFPWLFVNLLTAILASVVISQFEHEIETIVALAVLMPIVASMGGNAGTQSMTVAVRGLATQQLTYKNAFTLLFKEVKAGGLNGIILGLLLGMATMIWYDNQALGMVICAATILNHFLAATAGIIIPVMLEKYGKDPAVSSGVLLTTVTDVGGFFSFLGLAALFLL
jgi:magnesium transporter